MTDPDAAHGGTVRHVAATVVEVVAFDALAPAERGSRRAVVRWSDGAVGEALRWYDDEILVCEGDHGNSRLMCPWAEMRRAGGSLRAARSA